MCRNRILCGIALMTSLVLLSGCGDFKLVSETGSGKQATIVKEDYLKVDVLEGKKTRTEDKYKTAIVKKGTFVENCLSQSMDRYYANVPTVNFDVENTEGEFGEYLVDYMQYVNVGDTLATVYTKVDEVSIKEARLKLERLNERYLEDLAKYKEELSEKEQKCLDNYGEVENKKNLVYLEQCKLDWENTEYHYKRDIEEARERLDKLTETGSVISIKAPVEGYVFFTTRQTAGKKLEYGDYICHILDTAQALVKTDSQSDRFGYGMTFDFNVGSKKYTGSVIGGGTWGLYGNLDRGETIFQVGDENEQVVDNGRSKYIVNGSLATVSNVCIVPAKAVTIDASGYYVTVLNEDGSYIKTKFIPGGSTLEEIWVLDGLSEGMTIVYN